MRSILRKAWFLVALSALLPVAALSQTQTNPVTGINWPQSTGSGAPSSTLCTALTRGQPYTDITGNNSYRCGSSGWFQTNNGGSGGGSVASVFGRTGTVVAVTGDYSVGMISGAAPLVSAALTGTPTAPTQSCASNTDVATGAYVAACAAAFGSGVTKIVAGNNVTISPTGGTGTVTINSTSVAATAFSALTSSTNMTAAMLVGSGASLGATGTGTIAATSAAAVPGSGVTGSALASGITSALGLTTVAGGTFGTAAFQPTTAFDAAGAAATAQSNAETFAESVNTSGTAANLSGTPTLPNGTKATTQATGDATADLATDAFVSTSITAGGFLTTALANSTFAPLASPHLTGTPTAPTQACGSSTDIATDAYVAACAAPLGGVTSIIAGTNVTISPTSGIGAVTITATSTGATAFSALTGSTNTSAAMLVGSGASLSTTGSGVITATAVPGSGLTGTALASGITTAAGLTTAAGGAFGSAAFQSVSAFDASGTAAALLTSTHNVTGAWTFNTTPALSALGASTSPLCTTTGGVITNSGCAAGAGNVTSFSAGNLSPLFTASVATATSTPALTFTGIAQAANSVFGNFTSGSAVPTFSASPAFSAASLTNFPTLNQNTTGNAATATAVAGTGLTGTTLSSGITTAPGLTTVAGGAFGTAAFQSSLAFTPAGTALPLSGGTISSTSTTPLDVLNPSMATAGFNAIVLGHATTADNSASIVFNNTGGTGSTSNTLGLGIAGSSTVNIGVGGTLTVPGALTVNANTNITAASNDSLIVINTGAGEQTEILALQPSLPTGDSTFIGLGAALATDSGISISFNNIGGSGSTSNTAGIGLINGPEVTIGATGQLTVPGSLTVSSIGASTSPLCTTTGGQLTNAGCAAGSVSSVSSGNLSTLFTVSIANPTTAPAFTFAPNAAAANTVFGNFTSSSTVPAFSAAPVFSAAGLTNFPTFNQNTTGTSANVTATTNATLTTLSALTHAAGGTFGTAAFQPSTAFTAAGTTLPLTGGSLTGALSVTNSATGNGPAFTVNSGSTSSVNAVEVFAPSIATGGFNGIYLGTAASANNGVELLFNNVGGAGSGSNTFTMGLLGDPAVTVNSSGSMGIPGTLTVETASNAPITVVSTATASLNFMQLFESGLGTGGASNIVFGVSNTGENGAALQFNNVGTGSSSNTLTMGLIGDSPISVGNGGALTVPGQFRVSNSLNAGAEIVNGQTASVFPLFVEQPSLATGNQTIFNIGTALSTNNGASIAFNNVGGAGSSLNTMSLSVTNGAGVVINDSGAVTLNGLTNSGSTTLNGAAALNGTAVITSASNGTLTIDNTTTTNGEVLLNAIQPSLVSGGTNSMGVGLQFSTNNSALVEFNNLGGLGSASNTMGLGMAGGSPVIISSTGTLTVPNEVTVSSSTASPTLLLNAVPGGGHEWSESANSTDILVFEDVTSSTVAMSLTGTSATFPGLIHAIDANLTGSVQAEGVAAQQGFSGGPLGASLTLGPSTVVGTGASISCTTSHDCDEFSGSVTLITGTGITSSESSAALTVTFPVTRTFIPNCTFQVHNTSSPSDVTSAFFQDQNTISNAYVPLINLAPSTTFQLVYICGGS